MLAAHSGASRAEARKEGAAGQRPVLETYDRDAPGRSAVEDFIGQIFRERYGARLAHFAPRLVALRGPDGIEAAAGYRGGREPLFLERYLDAPIETLLAPHAGVAPTRRHIVEVGHLAAARPGAGRRLILALGQHLAGGTCQWVVSTLTDELRHLLVRMGVTPLALGVADPARLGRDAGAWGTYYEHHPVVLAGQLESAMRRLQAHRSRP